MIVNFPKDISIRKAREADLPAIRQLLNECDLPDGGMEACVENAIVAIHHSEIVGCAALEMYDDSALLRSVAVHERFRSRKLGIALTETILKMAEKSGISLLYLLTETAAKFFPRFGFQFVPREQVPANVKTSPEFTTLCPDSALAMQLDLTTDV